MSDPFIREYAEEQPLIYFAGKCPGYLEDCRYCRPALILSIRRPTAHRSVYATPTLPRLCATLGILASYAQIRSNHVPVLERVESTTKGRDLLRCGEADRNSVIVPDRDCALIEISKNRVMIDLSSIATCEFARAVADIAPLVMFCDHLLKISAELGAAQALSL
jgi:hypothetical protein